MLDLSSGYVVPVRHRRPAFSFFFFPLSLRFVWPDIICSLANVLNNSHVGVEIPLSLNELISSAALSCRLRLQLCLLEYH